MLPSGYGYGAVPAGAFQVEHAVALENAQRQAEETLRRTSTFEAERQRQREPRERAEREEPRCEAAAAGEARLSIVTLPLRWISTPAVLNLRVWRLP